MRGVCRLLCMCRTAGGRNGEAAESFAFLNGSDTIRLSDCTLLSYCLWSEMDQMEAAEEMVNAAIQKSAEGYLLNIKGLEQDIEELKDRQSSEHSLREVNDPGIQVIDTYYYQVEGVRMKERLLILQPTINIWIRPVNYSTCIRTSTKPTAVF